MKYFKEWGCLANVEVPLPKRVKIGRKTVDCVFIGYSVNNKACMFFVYKSDNPEIYVSTIIESNNAEFFEYIFICITLNVSRKVKDLNYHEKNQRKIHYLVRIVGVELANRKPHLSDQILWH